MTALAPETREVHTRLLKCALEVEDARAYWTHAGGVEPTSAKVAFQDYWFGAKSLERVRVLLTNHHARFDAFPPSLSVLHRWSQMEPDTRALICHWHLQLSDPLYRAFTGTMLVERREGLRAEITRDRVVSWVGDQGPGRWTMPTRIQFASKLLSAAFSAGLVASNRDPRPLVTPRVGDEPLAYLLYLLRGVAFEGTMLDNPYLRSVGLHGRDLESRLRALPALRFQRQGELTDFGWRFDSLQDWARATLEGEQR